MNITTSYTVRLVRPSTGSSIILSVEAKDYDCATLIALASMPGWAIDYKIGG
jgi:hypothetical protein